jgi:hypothetical protein
MERRDTDIIRAKTSQASNVGLPPRWSELAAQDRGWAAYEMRYAFGAGRGALGAELERVAGKPK